VRGRKVCYLCCGVLDREQMMRAGQIKLYLSQLDDTEWGALQVMTDHSQPPYVRYMVKNQCSSLVIKPYHVSGTVRFIGPDGYDWYGRRLAMGLLKCARRREQSLSYGAVVWTSKDGRQTPLWRMERGHLHSCIAMITRNLRKPKGSTAYSWAHMRRTYIEPMQKILDIKTRRGDPWRESTVAALITEYADVLELEVTQ
jgi:hypothetical protein